MEHIVYIADENFVIPTLVSIRSLIVNANNPLEIHIICVEMSADSCEQLKSSETDKIKIQLHRVDDEYKDLFAKHTHVSKAALFKFKLSEIFSDLDKILYVDGDIIFNKGFEQIFSYDISEYYAAVVQDMLAVVRDSWATKLGVEKYFNSGVMYLNLKKLRADDCCNKLIEAKKNEIVKGFMDQNVLNTVLGKNVLYLDCRFNFLVTYLRMENCAESIASFFDMDLETVNNCIKTPYIVHFTDSKKVWKDVTAVSYENWIKYCDPSLILSLVKNYCTTISLSYVAESDKINELENKIAILSNKIAYVEHRTIYGFFQCFIKKIFHKKRT